WRIGAGGRDGRVGWWARGWSGGCGGCWWPPGVGRWAPRPGGGGGGRGLGGRWGRVGGGGGGGVCGWGCGRVGAAGGARGPGARGRVGGSLKAAGAGVVFEG